MRLRWSPEALDDLLHIREHIDRDHPGAARDVVLRIVCTVEHILTRHPQFGRPGRVPGTRDLVIPRLPYLVPYRVGADTIDILRIFHVTRRWPDAL